MAVPPNPFQSILNFRDVGESINSLQSAVILRQGRLFRGARPDDATWEDRESLVLKYQIKTIVDLRSKTEHIQQSKSHDGKAYEWITQLHARGEVAPMKIPNIRYHEINLNGNSYERSLLKRLRYTSLAKLITLMAIGRRDEAIAILGEEVIRPRGLVGQAVDSIDSSGGELKQVFDILANSDNYPLFFHCTSGKDRTGLVTFLILLILDIPLEVIAVDYIASEGELVSESELRIRELRAMGLDDEFARCSPNWVMDVYRHIEQTYGSVQGYLDWIRVDEAARHKVKSNILAQSNVR